MQCDMNRSSSYASRGFSRWVLLIIIVVAFAAFAGLSLLFFRTRDIQRTPPRIIGNVWSSLAESGGRVYFVTREDRAETRAYDVDASYSYDHSYSLYVLHCRAADGRLLNSSLIARIETTSPDFKRYRAYATLPDGPGILGTQADVIWLWNKGPEARDLNTLNPVWRAADQMSRDPKAARLLPDDPKYTRVISPLDAMVFKGTDAAYYQIARGPGTGDAQFQPIDEQALAALSQEHSKTADSAFRTAPSRGKSLNPVSVSGLVVNDVLADGAWYALLSSDQRQALTGRLGFLEEWHLRTAQVHESAATLHAGTYAAEVDRSFQRTRLQLDLASVQPRGTARFIMAGFLRKPGAASEWSVEPASGAASATSGKAYVVLHRQAIGDKAPWLLTLLRTDGSEAWTCDTSLTEIGQVADAGSAIVLTGFRASDQPTALRAEQVLFINLASGTLNVLDLSGVGHSSPAP